MFRYPGCSSNTALLLLWVLGYVRGRLLSDLGLKVYELICIPASKGAALESVDELML
jgi:hypothetical protein